MLNVCCLFRACAYVKNIMLVTVMVIDGNSDLQKFHSVKFRVNSAGYNGFGFTFSFVQC